MEIVILSIDLMVKHLPSHLLLELCFWVCYGLDKTGMGTITLDSP